MVGLEVLQEVAKAKGGECLDAEFTTRSARYRFRCSRGHEWTAVAAEVIRGSWCLRCSHIDRSRAYLDPVGLTRLQTLARAKGGECLSLEYAGQSKRYLFRCGEGHEWETSGQKVIRGAWCPQCAHVGLSKSHLDPQGLQRLHAKAETHGGVCLSTEYSGAADRYRFRCAEGHEWDAIGASVLAGTWCPECARRKHAKQMTDADGLAKLQAAARRRGGECLSREYTTQGAYYAFRCERGHRWKARGGKVLQGQWCARCAVDGRKLGLDVARQMAGERGGLCLSDSYKTGSAKLKWQCSEGHVWEATMDSVRQGSWCPRCAYNRQRQKYCAAGLARLKAIVEARGGVLHSTKYRGNDVKYAFECDKGHFWITRGALIFSGTWCPECARQARISNPKSKARMRYLPSKRHQPLPRVVTRRVKPNPSE